MNTHEGVFICGYCKKESPLDDETVIQMIEGGTIDYFCLCGRFSYNSSIRFKAQINKKDWQGWMRGSAE